MGVESFLLASSVRAIVGQRLVRILCDHCKEAYPLTVADLAEDHRYAALGFKPGETAYRPKGCQFCNFVGFRGRKGVFEVLEVTEAVQRHITDKTDANDLDRIARAQGMTTMTEDAVAKCRAGLTTVDEIFRVTASL
jgi:general secretion pathway protein E